MSTNNQIPPGLGGQLTAVFETVIDRVDSVRDRFPMTEEAQVCSRDNLLAYLALREFDLTELQLALAEHGLSSLGRLEGTVLTSMSRVLKLVNENVTPSAARQPVSEEVRKIFVQRSQALLGRPREGRASRIMVTLDSQVLKDQPLVEQLLLNGMEIARINCAHESEREWLTIIEAIRHAEQSMDRQGAGVGRRCRILMDLGGPKIRVGALASEYRPLKLAAPRDDTGRPRRMLIGWLDSRAAFTANSVDHSDGVDFVIAVDRNSPLSQLQIGGRIRFVDARGKSRRLIILERCSPTRVRVGLEKRAYLSEGVLLETPDGLQLQVGPVAVQPVSIRVKAGDRLRIYRDPRRLGHRANEESPAGIACTLSPALENVVPGHRLFIDDGKISTAVRLVESDSLEVEVLSPAVPTRIRAEKGLNLPDTPIDLPAMTGEDREHLRFIATHADAVGLSFVHRPSDLTELADAANALGRPDLGMVAKIESAEAIHQIGRILLEGIKLPRFGIMIARGDLAVECGFENMAVIQEDLLCLCEAAHIPVIWATQVLETLAKTGLPARAEITDAAMGNRAECVMLNKGPHILEAVRTLAGLLSGQERHFDRKRQIFREFTQQLGIF